MPRQAYVNGRYVPHGEAAVHIEDRGYQFADGVYEVVPVYNGILVDEDPHLDRLDRSLRELRIEQPMTRAALKLVSRELMRRNGVSQVPVAKNEPPFALAEISGAVSELQLMNAAFADESVLDKPVEAIMAPALPTIGIGQSVQTAVEPFPLVPATITDSGAGCSTSSRRPTSRTRSSPISISLGWS